MTEPQSQPGNPKRVCSNCASTSVSVVDEKIDLYRCESCGQKFYYRLNEVAEETMASYLRREMEDPSRGRRRFLTNRPHILRNGILLSGGCVLIILLASWVARIDPAEEPPATLKERAAFVAHAVMHEDVDAVLAIATGSTQWQARTWMEECAAAARSNRSSASQSSIDIDVVMQNDNNGIAVVRMNFPKAVIAAYWLRDNEHWKLDGERSLEALEFVNVR